MAESLKLSVMEYDNVIATIDANHERVIFENYTDTFWKKPFGMKEKATWEDFLKYLESRCFPRTRFGCKKILKMMGLDYYDPLGIVRIQHGAQIDDHMWIRFEGENLQWLSFLLVSHQGYLHPYPRPLLRIWALHFAI